MPNKPKKHPRRKPIPGLTPDEVVRQMTEAASGKTVRKVREASPEKGPVLSSSREGGAGESGKGRVLAAPSGGDDQRSNEGGEKAVSDPGRETQLSRILKKMLGQRPPAELMDIEGVGEAATNAEMLAAVIVREALAGKQWAVEMVRDQTEGKPVRAAQMNNNESEIEDMLDRVSTNKLNQFTKG